MEENKIKLKKMKENKRKLNNKSKEMTENGRK